MPDVQRRKPWPSTLAAVTVASVDDGDWTEPDPVLVDRVASLLGLMAKAATAVAGIAIDLARDATLSALTARALAELHRAPATCFHRVEVENLLAGELGADRIRINPPAHRGPRGRGVIRLAKRGLHGFDVNHRPPPDGTTRGGPARRSGNGTSARRA